MREKRILVVTHYFATNGYGIERVAGRINELLRARGYRVRWLAAAADNGITRSFPSSPDEVGIRSWDWIRQLTDLAWPLFAPWQLPQIVRQVRQADVVHLHEAFYPLNQAALWIALLLRRPVVITQHIADMPISGVLRGNAVRLANLVMTRPAFAVADHVVYDSRRTQAHFGNLSRGKDSYVANGCDTDIFHPVEREEAVSLRRALDLPPAGVLALFVGRFIEKKGLHLLRDLAAAHPDVNFVFVGRGTVDPSAWNLPNVVVHPPVPLSELHAYYQASDVLLLPAVGEGLPLVVQEVCCCGVPPVLSREVLDACPELGPYAYDAGEGGSEIFSAFARFLAQPESRDRVRERAEFARRLWSWERCGDAYAEIFRTVLARAGERGRRRSGGRLVEEGR